MAEIRVIGVSGIPEAQPGDNLIELITNGFSGSGVTPERGDIVVVTHKLVSKAEGQLVDLDTVEPSHFARHWAERYEKDARQVEVVLQESSRIVRAVNGLIISETRHGFVCANAGVDASNVPGRENKHYVSLLPADPDASARSIREGLLERFGIDMPVIITDSFGRPWRRGIINVAIGVSGMQPLLDYRGQFDESGYELRATVIAVADEIASAAELIMGKLEACPVAIVRGYAYQPGEEGAASLVMEAQRDLFR